MRTKCNQATCWIAGILLAGSALLSGCQPKTICPPMSTAVSVETVVTEYNQNAVKVPRLWAYAKLAMTFRNKPGELGFTWGSTSGLASPNARLFLQKNDTPTQPQDFMLLIKETGAEVARVGISTHDQAYYMWFNMGDRKQCLFGRLPLAGAPGLEGIPIDPTQLPAVLGICQLPANQTKPPFVAQRISADPCAYVLTYLDRQPITGKIIAKREIYFDRTQIQQDGKLVDSPRRPFMVKIFDGDGRPTLTAWMKDYQSIELLDVDDEDAPPPAMPTDIKLRWHDTGSELHLVLSGMTTEDKVDPEAYYFWDRLPAGLRAHTRQIRLKLPPRKSHVGTQQQPKKNK